MKTLGQVIREWRKQQGLSQAELAAQTTVALDIIQLLEAEKTADLPAPVYVQGYLRLIALACHQSAETLLALYRRDTLPQPTNASSGNTQLLMHRWRQHWHWRWSPRQWSTMGIGVIVVGAAALLVWQWRLLARPPRLLVTSPQNYATLNSPVTIQGQTDKGAAVTLNTEAIPVDENGKFATDLSLPPGERTLVLIATDNHGRHSQVIIFVTIE